MMGLFYRIFGVICYLAAAAMLVMGMASAWSIWSTYGRAGGVFNALIIPMLFALALTASPYYLGRWFMKWAKVRGQSRKIASVRPKRFSLIKAVTPAASAARDRPRFVFHFRFGNGECRTCGELGQHSRRPYGIGTTTMRVQQIT